MSHSRKPKANRKPDESGALDMCQTPPYALTPLLPYIPKNAVVWESADGEGYMTNALSRAGLFTIPTDVIFGQDFFVDAPPMHTHQITNPPYSKKAQWIARSCELGTPWALLVPTETISRGDIQALMKVYRMEIMLLDRRIDFKMPSKGWDSHPQFPVVWLCHNMLPAPVNLGHISRGEVDDWRRACGLPVRAKRQRK